MTEQVGSELDPDDGRLRPPAPRLLSGEEPFTGTDAIVSDFWSWAMSDLRTNTVRPMLAEFLVARALSTAAVPRIEWDAYDVVTPDGVRVEVKSSAYLQAWEQAALSVVTFGGLRGRTWTATTGYAAEQSYNADVYVFAVVTARHHTDYDPLDVSQWWFWVLPRSIVESTGQASLGLRRVSALAGEGVSYEGLPAAVREAGAAARSPDE